MRVKNYILLGIIAVVGIFSFYYFQNEFHSPTISSSEEKIEIHVEKSLFRIIANKKDTIVVGNYTYASTQEFELKPEYLSLYQNLTNTSKNIVVIPTFTQSAYNKNGFYDFYRGDCDSSCTTVDIDNGYPTKYESSQNSVKILRLLGYSFITDIDIDKNPNILSNYETVILLHNEYVTKKEFEAIIKHPNVIYLYPNALYAEITPGYDDNTITLIRGHNFPDPSIKNGFDWKFDNTSYEYDVDCVNWNFYKINNGYMLNCYPEHVIYQNSELLKMLKYLGSSN